MLRKKTSSEIDYAGIHRALLSGLLGNIGQKTDQIEYTGARGTKFLIFPGSTLFKRKPQWLVSAEIVETTKLYARTNARINPEWIEQVAGHLVKRSYNEPRWDQDKASVVADEKVTLYGLPIIPRRLVHYGPIEPKIARTLFIHHALVEGEYETPAPFFAHNQKLLAEVRALEAKTRTRQYLVDAQTRFDFYDKRIPQGIFSGQLFEKWRRNAERHNPKLLFMSRRDLMLRSADDITPEAFPDFLLIGELRLPLEYHLDPGEVMDGVTATVPLAALNQVPDEALEWLVPGLLREKVLELIRTLPKPLRVNFVPAPDFADRAMEKLQFGDGSLYEALAIVMGKLSGLVVTAQDFDPTAVSDFLKMNLKVVDQQGRIVATGRDLAAIRKKLGIEASKTFRTLIPDPRFHRDNITRWDFGDLPPRIEIRRHGVTLGAYPALVDKVASVSLRLLDSPDLARTSHREGVRRLFMIQLGPELRHLWRNIPNLDAMVRKFARLEDPAPCDGAAGEAGGSALSPTAPQSTADELRAQIVNAAARDAFAADDQIRTAAAFAQRAASAWQTLSAQHRRIHSLAEAALNAHDEVLEALCLLMQPEGEAAAADSRSSTARPAGLVINNPGMMSLASSARYRGSTRGTHQGSRPSPLLAEVRGKKIPELLSPSVEDMKRHLARLMPRDFITTTPPHWLEHLPRFIEGIGVRLRKLLNAGLVRDRQGMEIIAPLEAQCFERLAKHQRERIVDQNLVQYRWLLEEMRISLFAQELRTSVPVSPQRLAEVWVKVKP